MSYSAAIDDLNRMAPELHTQPGVPRRKFSLDEIRVLLATLGDPHRKLPAVLIAGTNGKGSTAATLASILKESGLRTGLFTSPHLERPNERIRVDGVEIADDDFARRYFAVHDAGESLVQAGVLAQQPSFFETLTAMAFLHFAESGAEIAVLEVGMGGRLDATNIAEPLISVITDISFDHTEWLGDTIAAIAREKAGILRANGTLVTLPQHPEANQALGEVAVELNVRGVNAAAYMPPRDSHQAGAGQAGAGDAYPVEVLGKRIEVASPLHGPHQQRNVALAIAAAVELATHHALPITAESIAAGIRRTEWPGRLESIAAHGARWVLDVAHNPAGAWALRASLGSVEPAPRTLVFSCLHDKPLNELAQILFPLFEYVVFVPIASPRATPVAELMAAAEQTGTPAMAAGTVAEALMIARRQAGDAPIVVSGSVYLVGAARHWLMQEDGK
jgi:dihydrofolate synthase/folylpolyglutamate synthase